MADGVFNVSGGQTTVLSAIWLKSLEQQLRSDRIPKQVAKRIHRKVLNSRDLERLPNSLQSMNSHVADAAKKIIDQNIDENTKWEWLYRVAAFVGIIAGVNTFSSDYNIDTAIEWIKSNVKSEAHQPNNDVPSSKTMDEAGYDGPEGPR